MRTQQLIITFVSLICTSSYTFAQGQSPEARHYHLPAYCPIEELRVTAENTSPQSQEFWFQVEHPQFKELRVELKGQTKTSFEGTEFLNSQRAFTLKTFSNKLKFSATCTEDSVAFASDSSSWKSFKVPNENHLILHFINLSMKENIATINYKDSLGRSLETETLDLAKYYETLKRKVTLPHRTAYVEVKASGRFTATVANPTGKIYHSTALGPEPLDADKSAKYFLVSRKETWQESFVISLKDPALVQQAREQISQPQLEKIIVGYIKPGHGNANREITSKLSVPYSWHVDEVTSFADFAHIDCDGSPRLVEERLFERLEEKQGHICFWSYRVVRELTPSEISQGRLQQPKLLGREFLRH